MAFNQFPQKGGIPSGNTAARPSGPVIGDTFYNGQLEILEIWNGTAWVAISAPPATPSLSSVVDGSASDAYTTTTAGKITAVFTPGSGGGTPNQYNLYTTAGGFSASSSSPTVTITGLTIGTSYAVYGTAQNNFGTTVNTGTSANVTPTTKPQAPTIGTASTSSVTSDVVVTWTLGVTGGKNLSAITITPYLNGTTAQTAATAATTSSTSHTFTGLTEGSAYTFKVKTTTTNGDSPETAATNSVTIPGFISVEYLVIAGGGAGGGSGGGSGHGSGGGAGGYRTTTSTVLKGSHAVTVGAGGAGTTSAGTNATNSNFGTYTASRGGYGAAETGTYAAQSGGSGGGSYYSIPTPGAGNLGGYTPVEGYVGGTGVGTPPNYPSGGGGGSGGAGGNGSGTNGGSGGPGTASSITGTSVTRAGGGGGSTYSTGGTAGTGAAGGGNGASNGGSGGNATANSGSGGGGSERASGAANGGNGGSGIVILRYLTSAGTITVGAGLTGTTATDGSYKVTTITAGSGNVSWA